MVLKGTLVHRLEEESGEPHTLRRAVSDSVLWCLSGTFLNSPSQDLALALL